MFGGYFEEGAVISDFSRAAQDPASGKLVRGLIIVASRSAPQCSQTESHVEFLEC